MICRAVLTAFVCCARLPAWASEIPGEVLVRFRQDATPAAARRALDELDGREDGGVPGLRVKRVRLPPGLPAGEAIARLTRRPEVEFAEPNHTTRKCALPNDVYFPLQWALHNIQLDRAWSRNVAGSRGAGGDKVTIAILDTGICTFHPDLVNRIAPQTTWYNALSPGGSIQDDDPEAHGTFVAGEVAAATDNGGEGVAGMVWDGDGALMPVKILDKTGHGDLVAEANGILWATSHGAKVINMSLSTCDETGDCPDLSNITELEAIEAAHDAGVVVVAAAGNASSTSPSWPAAYPHVVAVSATDRRDRLAAYSNRGSYIAVAAPGGAGAGSAEEDVTGLGNAACIVGSTSYYDLLDGTSMAAPLVSGLAALLFARFPDKTNDQIVGLIERTADQPGGGGWTPEYGYGRINVYRALTEDLSPAPAAATAAAAAYAFPNPFSPKADRFTTFVARPAAGEAVRVRIYDALGALVWERALTATEAAAADLYYDDTSLRWDGTDRGGRALANGVYLARIELGTRTLIKRVVIAQ